MKGQLIAAGCALALVSACGGRSEPENTELTVDNPSVQLIWSEYEDQICGPLNEAVANGIDRTVIISYMLATVEDLTPEQARLIRQLIEENC